MPLEGRVALGLLIAVAAVYALTPVAIRVAHRLSFFDVPVGYKGHRRPTPYLGGSAIMVGFAIAILAVAAGDAEQTAVLLGGMLVLWAIGTVDDRINVAPGWRVGAEIGLGWLLWRMDLGWSLEAGSLIDLTLTVVWVVAVVNAFNLFDNMDGAASVMAIVVSLCVVALGAVHGDVWVTIAAATLSGACIGFLPHNLSSPARIFLGDGGSMPVGFAVATLVMVGAADAVPAWQSLVLGLLLVGVPALDTVMVTISRRRRGVGILTGGRDHLTHRTQQWLSTAGAVAIALGTVQALVSAVALFAIRGGPATALMIVVLYLTAAVIAIAFFEARYKGDETQVPGQARVRFFDLDLQNAWPLLALVTALGALLGASAFWSGFYAPSQWVPIGLGALVAATAGTIASPLRLSRLQVAALVGLSGIGLWSLLSAAWAPSIADATHEANRWLALAAFFAMLIVLVRTDQLGRWLAMGIGAGIAVVAAYVLVRMLGSAPTTLFLGGRLNEPLGYTNGLATVLIMGMWLWLSLSERRSVALGALGVGVATALGSLSLLSASRGAVLGMIGSAAVVLLVVPGQRLRRCFTIATVGVAMLLASSTLLDLTEIGAAGPVPPSWGHKAAVAILLAAAGAGLFHGLARAVFGRLEGRGAPLAAWAPRAGRAALIGAVLVAVALGVSSAGRIDNYVSTQWDAFVQVSDPGTISGGPSNRLQRGSGTRYDYWRIAWHAFEDRPFGGVGAGNYSRPYFRARQTAENVRQPHSLELQTLSELGIGGLALLLTLLGSLVLAIWRVRLSAPARASGIAVAGTGALAAFLLQSAVDWVHLIPGIAAIALAIAAILMRAAPTPAPAPAPGRLALLRLPSRRAAAAAAAVAAVVLVVAVASLSRQGLADLFQTRAKNALASDPASALREADRSLRLDGEDPATYYVKAAALARFNDGAGARRTLLQALSKEPDNFVSWTLLGDLATRRGDSAEARSAYRRALALNPRDPTLRKLAREPRQARS